MKGEFHAGAKIGKTVKRRWQSGAVEEKGREAWRRVCVRRGRKPDLDVALDAKRYAKRSVAGPPGTYRVVFSGVRSADDYIRLAGYLQGLAVIRKITPIRATPDTLEYDLELLSGLPGLKRMTDAGDTLVQLDGLEGQPPVFQLH